MVAAPFDSSARRVVRNQKKFINLIPPIVVAWLLQYSGSRVEHRDEFSSQKLLAVEFNLVNLFWILRFGENSGLNCLETENTMK